MPVESRVHGSSNLRGILRLFEGLHGRHQVGRKASATSSGSQRNSMGSGNDGEKPEEKLPLQQSLRERHLSQVRFLGIFHSSQTLNTNKQVVDLMLVGILNGI